MVLPAFFSWRFLDFSRDLDGRNNGRPKFGSSSDVPSGRSFPLAATDPKMDWPTSPQISGQLGTKLSESSLPLPLVAMENRKANGLQICSPPTPVGNFVIFGKRHTRGVADLSRRAPLYRKAVWCVCHRGGNDWLRPAAMRTFGQKCP